MDVPVPSQYFFHGKQKKNNLVSILTGKIINYYLLCRRSLMVLRTPYTGRSLIFIAFFNEDRLYNVSIVKNRFNSIAYNKWHFFFYMVNLGIHTFHILI